MSSSYRLKSNGVSDLYSFMKQRGFEQGLTDYSEYCSDNLTFPSVQAYGIYNQTAGLTAVAIATFCRIAVADDAPTGKICIISGVYTLEPFRHRGQASKLLESIETDATNLKCDYICVDSLADDLYFNRGFELAPRNETRMWKRLY